jgi:crotonobetainyl-CoA:carnitine CoA-transferase CaiB-like acyl-CoA transferase
VAADDINAFEVAVRAMLQRLRDGERLALARSARAEAERLFAPTSVATALLATLSRVGDTPHLAER